MLVASGSSEASISFRPMRLLQDHARGETKRSLFGSHQIACWLVRIHMAKMPVAWYCLRRDVYRYHSNPKSVEFWLGGMSFSRMIQDMISCQHTAVLDEIPRCGTAIWHFPRGCFSHGCSEKGCNSILAFEVDLAETVTKNVSKTRAV